MPFQCSFCRFGLCGAWISLFSASRTALLPPRLHRFIEIGVVEKLLKRLVVVDEALRHDSVAPFKTRAEKGEMIEISKSKAAYQAKVDYPIGNSRIYFVLHRQNQRKVMPRSRHPKKAGEKVIETSKKLKLKSEN